ncbi:hypothetical protein BDZ89DRAFT_1139368 [Hymenopellis radicata]|nr:hypothetical protein BDZ89DRAFT_1139368 [Hymenopellis radicata]
MSVATPTLLPRPARFPHLLPPAPRVLPQPLKRRTSYGHLNATRNLQKELDDLSDEEVDLEEQNTAIHNRGYSYLVPIGRSLTQKEEKADAGEDDDGDDGPGDTDESTNDDEDDDDEDEDEDEEEDDMDAELEDLDADVPEDVDM